MKAFAYVGLDGEVYGVHENREELVAILENDPLLMGSVEESIKEFEYNDEPITARGEEFKALIEPLMKNVRRIHMSKQIGFYEMHVDDRLELIYRLLSEPGEDLSFNDARWSENVVDIDNFNVEHHEESLDKALKSHGID